MKSFVVMVGVILSLSIVISMSAEVKEETLKIRVHGTDSSKPTLIYLPGLHGDWTLVSSFRHEITNHARFIEFTYPRSLTWSLDEYARAIETALLENDITEGWILAESFGSQVAWTFINKQSLSGTFNIQGLVLAGGFVKHPNAPGIFIAKQFTSNLPHSCFRSCLKLYAKYARFRHRHAPETLAGISEFMARRTRADRAAMTHRLDLIAGTDLRPIARATHVPVFALAGFWDPIVPRVLTRVWLKKHCPGFKEAKMIAAADHNVLGTAPEKAAEVVREWMR